MTNEELINTVREEVRKELAPIYEQMEAFRNAPPTPGEKKEETPSIAEEYLKQKEYFDEHLTGRGLGLPDESEGKKI